MTERFLRTTASMWFQVTSATSAAKGVPALQSLTVITVLTGSASITENVFHFALSGTLTSLQFVSLAMNLVKRAKAQENMIASLV